MSAQNNYNNNYNHYSLRLAGWILATQVIRGRSFAMYEEFKTLLVKHTVGIVVLYILAVSSLFMLSAQAYKSWFYDTLTQDVASVYSDTLDSLHRFYSEQISTRAQHAGIELSMQFADTDDTLPFPITFSNAFGQQLSQDVPGLSITIYSDHPFPSQRQRQLTARQVTVLHALRDTTNGEVMQLQDNPTGDYDLLTLARPIAMKQSCLSCHNDPVWQLGKTWQDGEFRGVREITIPVMRRPELVEGMLPLTLGLAFIAAISGGILVLPLVRHMKSTLEQSERLRQHLGHLTRHDPLTGAANNNWFRQRMDEVLDSRHGPDDHIGLLFLDMDNFKGINDTFGHHAGDQALKAVCNRITAHLNKYALLGRVGGDEFVVMFDNPASHCVMEALAERILKSVKTPVMAEHGPFDISVSIGLTYQSKKTATAHSLLDAADKAMYDAKQKGKNQYALCALSAAAQLASINRRKITSKTDAAPITTPVVETDTEH